MDITINLNNLIGKKSYTHKVLHKNQNKSGSISEVFTESFTKSVFTKDLKKLATSCGIKLNSLIKFKLILTLIGAAFGIFLTIFTGFTIFNLIGVILVLVSSFIGFSLIDLYIIDKNLENNFKVYSNIPFFIDMISLFTVAGIHSNFNEMLKDVASNIDKSVQIKLKEITKKSKILSSKETLQKTEDEFNDKFIYDLASVLKLNTEYGGKSAEKIESIADNAYLDRELKFKEVANAASGKLLIPLMIFHLPVILALFLIPALLSFTKSF